MHIDTTVRFLYTHMYKPMMETLQLYQSTHVISNKLGTEVIRIHTVHIH